MGFNWPESLVKGESRIMSSEDRESRPALISCAGVLASLALHILLMTPVLIEWGANTKRPDSHSNEIQSSAGDDALSSSMTATLIDEGDVGVSAQANEAADRLAAADPSLKTVPVIVPEPKFNLPAEDADPGHDGPQGSSQPDPGRQLLFGRYVGQITARIERAWMRPRTPIQDGALFACRVSITQDRRGVVQEVELVRCNGTPRWQSSLVQAIQSASPLPAPPDPDVYNAHLTLTLESTTFSPSDSTDGFAPP